MKRIGFAVLAGANMQSFFVLALFGYWGYGVVCLALALIMVAFAALEA